MNIKAENLLAKLKVEHIVNDGSDLFIANVARTSFHKWKNKEQADWSDNKGSDRRLLFFLGKEGHISPFFHSRYVIPVPYINFENLTPTLMMGLVFKRIGTSWYIKHSIYGFKNLIECKVISSDVLQTLFHLNPVAMEALTGLNPLNVNKLKIKFPAMTSILRDDDFIDFSFRITAPIPIARQLFTHRMFATNEVSRRYVDTPPEFYFPTCFRKRPEGGIKQGSSSKCIQHLKKERKKDVSIKDAYTNYIKKGGQLYEQFIESGVAPEVARFLLPQSMETTIIFTGSKENWRKMINNRTDPHAQEEIRKIALEIEKLID